MNVESHSWALSPMEAISLQKTLAERVLAKPLAARLKVVGATDISYSRNSDLLIAVIVTCKLPGMELIESVHHVGRASFPYIPGLLSFREIPPLLGAYAKIGQKPDVILCDGQGIAHPRKLGLAAHFGLCLDIATIGCAKSRLCGSFDEPPQKKGSSRPLFLNGEQVGIVYRSRDGVQPIYISPGHLCDLKSSKKFVARCIGRYRIPEPIRLAHSEANRKRLEIESQVNAQSQINAQGAGDGGFDR